MATDNVNYPTIEIKKWSNRNPADPIVLKVTGFHSGNDQARAIQGLTACTRNSIFSPKLREWSI
jgi:hypothetical protein